MTPFKHQSVRDPSVLSLRPSNARCLGGVLESGDQPCPNSNPPTAAYGWYCITELAKTSPDLSIKNAGMKIYPYPHVVGL
jgi:hypothetical protein